MIRVFVCYGHCLPCIRDTIIFSHHFVVFYLADYYFLFFFFFSIKILTFC